LPIEKQRSILRTSFNRQSAIENRQLQRSFQFPFQFLAATRQPRLHGSNIDIEGRGNLFICETFDISQYYSFPVSSTDFLQR
jgi:hypothetical protein